MPFLAPLPAPVGGGGGHDATVSTLNQGEELDEEVGKSVNLEVGEIVVQDVFSYTLVILAEVWPDWLLVVTQSWARVYVFCDCDLRENFLKGLGSLEEKVTGWYPVQNFESHSCLKEANLCVLASGGNDFIRRMVNVIPTETAMAIALLGAPRRGGPPEPERMQWTTIQHKQVGGVTTLRCVVLGENVHRRTSLLGNGLKTSSRAFLTLCSLDIVSAFEKRVVR